MSRSTVLLQAQTQVGITENPAGSNLQKYGAAYGFNGVPWCVIFLWWVFQTAGEGKAFYDGGKTASCGVLMRWAKSAGRWKTENPQPGDIVILNFSGNSDTEHCGLITKVIDAQSFQTIEGNTTPGLEGSQDNGGNVAIKIRRRQNAIGYFSPKYSDENAEYEGHWAQVSIDRLRALGIMQGYPDGTFQPDKEMTRAEFSESICRLLDDLGR